MTDQILPGALGTGETTVPVYLPDRTEVGRAKVNLETGTAEITINSDSKLNQLFKENLAGISIMYFDRDAAEEIINETENKENN